MIVSVRLLPLSLFGWSGPCCERRWIASECPSSNDSHDRGSAYRDHPRGLLAITGSAACSDVAGCLVYTRISPGAVCCCFVFSHRRQQRKIGRTFAYPAAIGDIIVAIFALLLIGIVAGPSGRLLIVIWNAAGLFDILFVVSDALWVGVRDWTGMAPLRELPVSLLPTFVVPLIMASHIFIRLARRRT